jgi:hypothetical protein
MRFAEHKREGHNEEFVANVVADVQNPATPILCAVCRGQRTHNASSVVSRFRQVADSGAVSIEQDPLRVGAVEVNLGHCQPPVALRCETPRFEIFSNGEADNDAARNSTHIQGVMRGKRIICTPPRRIIAIRGC